MKIAVIAPHVENPWQNTGDYFISLGTARLLAGHPLSWLSLHAAPTDEDLRTLAAADLIVVGGSNIVGSQGTVRMQFSAEVLEDLRVPILPLAIGAQAHLGHRPKVNRKGHDLLSLWGRASPAISVRDRLTYDFLGDALGPEKVTLTGCSALWIGPVGRAKPKREDVVVCPGPFYIHPLPWKNRRYWQVLRMCCELFEPTSVLGVQPETSHFSRVLNRPVLNFGGDPFSALNHITTARALMSARIHPVLAAAQSGVPSVLLAMDERTRSMAELLGVPTVLWSDHRSLEEWRGEILRALESYDQGIVDARLDSLRDEMRTLISRCGLGSAPSKLEEAIQNAPPWKRFPETPPSLATAYAVMVSKFFPWLYPSLERAYRILRNLRPS